ncbi:flagellar hook-basal body complex protein [Anaplasmataceae bacterium AB001_6]|nr:flagellar hook-basal body complex protein [Anaplasmataceae bacterium AB001_6]
MARVDVFNTGSSVVNDNNIKLAESSVNIANVDTVAFKSSDFYSLLIAGGKDIIGARQVKEYNADQDGAIVTTTNNYNMAVTGRSWMIVESDDGKKGFSRDGSFNLDAQKYLTNHQGLKLSAWKIEEGQTYSTIDSTEAVNFTDVGVTAEATTRVLFDMNLNASDENAKGVGETVKLSDTANDNVGAKDLILPDNSKIFVGDELALSNSDDEFKINFGGIAASSGFANGILGVNNAQDTLTGINNGDTIVIKTETGGEEQFVFNTTSGSGSGSRFSDLEGLVNNINRSSNLAARVYNGRLFIGSNNGDDSIAFATRNASGRAIGVSNATLRDSLGIVSSPKDEIVSSKLNAMFEGVITDEDSSFTGAAGVNNGDSFTIRLSNGSEHKFTVNSVAGPAKNTDDDIATKGYFDTIKELTAAINSVDELDATFSGDQMTIKMKSNYMDNVSVLAILDHGGNATKLVNELGIGFSSSMGADGRVSLDNFDSTEISYGGYESIHLNSIIPTDEALDSITQVKSAVLVDDIFRNNFHDAVQVAGCYDPLVKITKKEADGLKVMVNGGVEQVFTYKAISPDASLKEFNSLNTLKDALDKAGLLKSNMADNFITIGDASSALEYVTGINGHEADVLGITFQTLTAGDTLNISTENGKKSALTFGASADLDAGVFATLQDLYQLMNKSSEQSLDFMVEAHGDISIARKSDGWASRFKEISGTSAGKIFRHGDSLLSTTLNVQYNPNTNDYAVGNTFHDLFSFKKNVENLSKNALTVTLSKDSNNMVITTNNGSKLHRLDDKFHQINVQDDSLRHQDTFAKNAGLKAGDLVNVLGLHDISKGSNRFSTKDGMNKAINHSLVVHSEIDSKGNVVISASDIRDIFYKKDSDDNIGSDMVGFFGLTEETQASYDPEIPGYSIISGAIKPNYQTEFTIYDSLGDKHNMNMSFVKFENNQWGFEIFANDKTSIESPNGDGLLAYGSLNFGGDGMYQDGTSSIPGFNIPPTVNDGKFTFPIIWTNGANPSEIEFWIEAAPDDAPLEYQQTAGIRQFAADNSYLRKAQIDGYPTGEMENIEINEDGLITAIFTNSARRSVYRVPLATFNNAKGLILDNNGMHYTSSESGSARISTVADSGSTLSVGAYEKSNVDLNAESMRILNISHITNVGVALLSQADEMMERLLRLVQA